MDSKLSNQTAWRASMERGGLPVCPGHVACNNEHPGQAPVGSCKRRQPLSRAEAGRGGGETLDSGAFEEQEERT